MPSTDDKPIEVVNKCEEGYKWCPMKEKCIPMDQDKMNESFKKIISYLHESKGFDINIEKATVDNTYFRKVLFTTDNIQLVVMSIKDEIGMETHDTIAQFIRVEAGKGKASIDGREFPLKPETAFIIPKGSKHNIWNTGKEDLKLYSVYAPPNHAPGTIHKTKEDADQAELSEAGFENKPRGWDKNSIQKYTNTFTKKMKGGAKAEGFFKKCVEKMKDKMDNPEGFCASIKDETYGSTGWRGKDKSPKEINKDIKKTKFQVESDTAINEYLDFIVESDASGIINDGAPLPNELILMLEYDERPNWIGHCIRKYDKNVPSQIKCLQAVKEYAAANPFYQYRIDRYIDRIMDNWDGSSEPYPTQNPDEREMNLGTTGRSYEDGYTNHDELEPGMLENFPDMSGGGGMGCRVPPADTDETEERDEDNIINPPKKWSRTKKHSGMDKLTTVDVDSDQRLVSNHDMKIEETGMASRIPSRGIKSDTEEGEKFYGEPQDKSELKEAGDLSELDVGTALGVAAGIGAVTLLRNRKNKKCQKQYPNDPKKVQDCIKRGI